MALILQIIEHFILRNKKYQNMFFIKLTNVPELIGENLRNTGLNY